MPSTSASRKADQSYTWEVAARRPGNRKSACQFALRSSSLRFEGGFARAMLPEIEFDKGILTRDRDPDADARAAAEETSLIYFTDTASGASQFLFLLPQGSLSSPSNNSLRVYCGFGGCS